MRRDQSGRPGSSRPRASAKPPAWRSPIFLVTAAAVIFAIGLVIVLNLKPGSAGSTAALTPPTNEIPAGLARDGQVLGAAGAPVTIDMWGDFQCPACAKFANTVEPQIIDKYVVPGQARFKFNDYTFIGQESYDAAVAARCAGDQGKFWEFNGYLYANQKGENAGHFSKEFLASVGSAVGLDSAKYETCLADAAKLEAIKASTVAGAKVGVNQTPTLSIDGKILQFTTYEELYSQIEAAIVAAGGSPASAAPASSTPASAAPASPSTAP
jgi:protein-disulfide isomerase